MKQNFLCLWQNVLTPRYREYDAKRTLICCLLISVHLQDMHFNCLFIAIEMHQLIDSVVQMSFQVYLSLAVFKLFDLQSCWLQTQLRFSTAFKYLNQPHLMNSHS